ncbi:MAG TPA: alpha-hydroxy-acid oxidizing protein [Steroidobacteraceae bacterium]|jgi:isopentenyl diphosphate isomerase/L-lactate dehydrogenase-like FMN-dependent dehydrogenase|nr:alpha-hydroxy-acid oxidizing protein [Steroidobacteraceae bacterium]
MSLERRALLKFLAASPLFTALPPWSRALADEHLPASAADALDVFEFEAVAQRLVPPAHWGYLQSGVDGDVTLRANQAAYGRYQLRPRRLVDVSHIDLATEVFGIKAASPIGCWPIGSLRALNPEGDIAVARATKKKNAFHIMSTQASFPVEAINEARGTPVWYQLYTTNQFEVTRKLVKRAESAGCPVVAVTVDTPAGRNTETASRLRREDTRTCSTCHAVDEHGNPRNLISTKPMFGGIDTQGLGLTQPSLTWDFVKRLKDVTKMKVVLKGIESGLDAMLAVENGADGIIVSNHGGRSIESGRATLESLPEVVQGVAGAIPVLVDGGIRRGTDAFKALALGASAVGIGRPYAWGLAAFGQDGVERVLDILNLELRLAMVGCGARSIHEIIPSTIIDVRPGPV